MFELAQLEYLITIAEQGTLSKAAQILHISQPALTRSMQKLESDLNVTLFIRSKNKIELNEVGQQAVQFAYKIMDESQHMVEHLRILERNQSIISIGACAPGPIWNIKDLIKHNAENKPVISELKEPDVLIQGLHDDYYHVIITTTPIIEENIISRYLCNEQLYVAIPPNHPLQKQQEVSFEELNGESFMLLSQIGFWYQFCKDKLPDSMFLVQEETAAINELIKMSKLLSFVSDISRRYDRKTNNRMLLPISDADANVDFYWSIKKENRKLFHDESPDNLNEKN